MNDFDSLKAGQSFAGSLLRSATDDAPGARARRLAASSLGLVGITSVVPSALAAGEALGTAATQVVVPAGVKSISALVISKWFVSSFVIGVVASGSAVTTYEVVTSREAPPVAAHRAPMPARASQTTGAPERTPGAPAQPPTLEPQALEADVTPVTQLRTRATAANVAAASTSAPERRVPQQPSAAGPQVPSVEAASSLDQEIAWLEPARRSLQANDGQQALAALDQAAPHVRLLASEAALLRVEALLLSGRRTEAERLAQPFLDRHASSPHAERLRRLLGQR